MLVNGSIPSLVSGVSQQPTAQRLKTHCDLCDNAFLSPTDGLTKRPPTYHVANLFTNSAPQRPFVHWINRSESERYAMIFQSGAVNIFDLQGNSYIVTFAPGTSNFNYLNTSGGNPDQTLRALTIGDTTFVTNTLTKVAMTAGGGDGTLHWTNLLINIKEVVLGGTYAVSIDTVSASYIAPTSGTVTTDSIAAALQTNISTALGGNYTAIRGGSVVWVTKNVGGVHDFSSFSYADSANGESMGFVTNNARQFSDLPNTAPPGMVVKVAALDPTTGATNNSGAYYVGFVPVGTPLPGGLWLGIWQEVAGPSTTSNIIDATTMPYQLVRLQDQTGSITGHVGGLYFEYGPVQWAQRVCGDSTTAPNPSFVGFTINEIFLYQNRLGFLTDTKVVMSQSGSFTDFWRSTMLTVLDSDPIDVYAAHPRVARLRHAVPFATNLIIFADQVQFLFGPATQGGALTPSTVSMSATTEYESDIYTRPIPVANMIYMPYRIENFGAVREYYVEYYTQRHIGRSVTNEVPKYIKGNIRQMSHCVSSDLVTVITDADPGSMYIWKWLWEGNTLYTTAKLQSAWSRWNFDVPGAVNTYIVSTFFIGQQCWVVVSRTFGTTSTCTLETMTVDALPYDQTASGQPWVAYLDRKVVNPAPGGAAAYPNAGVTQSYNSGNNTTTFTLPYKFPNTAPMAVTEQNTGVGHAVLSVGSNTVTVSGNLLLTPVWIGQNYTMRYRFSSFWVREQSQSGETPVLNGRLQVKTVSVSYASSGYFRFEITPSDRPLQSYAMNGNRLGDGSVPLGSPPLLTDQMKCLVACKNDRVQIDLVNDTPLPSRFSNAEWEAIWFPRAKRL